MPAKVIMKRLAILRDNLDSVFELARNLDFMSTSQVAQVLKRLNDLKSKIHLV